MRTINKVILIGNLTRDVELKETQGGQKIATFGIATNREWVTADKERHESAEFTECIAWAKLGEICAKFLKKGKFVYIEGYLKTRSWDQEDGTRKHRTEVVVEDMVMLEKRQDGNGGGGKAAEADKMDDEITSVVKEEDLPGDEEIF